MECSARARDAQFVRMFKVQSYTHHGDVEVSEICLSQTHNHVNRMYDSRISIIDYNFFEKSFKPYMKSENNGFLCSSVPFLWNLAMQAALQNIAHKFSAQE